MPYRCTEKSQSIEPHKKIFLKFKIENAAGGAKLHPPFLQIGFSVSIFLFITSCKMIFKYIFGQFIRFP